MKVELSNTAIQEIDTAIALGAVTAITKKVHELEDEELIHQLRAGEFTDRERVETYLKQTKLNTIKHPQGKVISVENVHLARTFGITVPAMKKIRDELAATGRVMTSRKGDRLTIQYLQPAPPSPTDEGASTACGKGMLPR